MAVPKLTEFNSFPSFQITHVYNQLEALASAGAKVMGRFLDIGQAQL